MLGSSASLFGLVFRTGCRRVFLVDILFDMHSLRARFQLVDLEDAILALQVTVGITPSSTVFKDADVNGDDKIGLHEVVYILSKVSALR